MGPDLPRNLGKLDVLTSPVVLNTYCREKHTLDVKMVRSMHNAKMLALAVNCAPFFPAVSTAMMSRMHTGFDASVDDAMRYKVDSTGAAFEAGQTIDMAAADRLVSAQIADRPDQFRVMSQLFGATPEEWQQLCLSL
jgi:hypothetical protein